MIRYVFTDADTTDNIKCLLLKTEHTLLALFYALAGDNGRRYNNQFDKTGSNSAIKHKQEVEISQEQAPTNHKRSGFEILRIKELS